MLVKDKEASRFGVLSLPRMANSDSGSSIYDEVIEFQLKDEDSDDRMLAQPGVVAYHGEPLADHSETQIKRMLM